MLLGAAEEEVSRSQDFGFLRLLFISGVKPEVNSELVGKVVTEVTE